MQSFKESACLCALNRIFGFEPMTGHTLLKNLGSAENIFSLAEKDKDALLGPYSRYRSMICERACEEAASELESLSGKGISFIGCTDDSYPRLLKECEDHPLGIYFKGRSTPDEVFGSKKNIAVVGTRDISPYGREWCRRIIDNLAEAEPGITIVSGLALGTDICAHTAALENGIPTIAVMATGPDSIYPHRHTEFAERIANTDNCALITDYPPGTAPLAIHFLRRNRIIAGISDATLLIESKIKGGGMTTARLAFSYSRDVHTLPGRADDTRSHGCNYLIKSKIAEPILSENDLTESLGLKAGPGKKGKGAEEFLKDRYGKRLTGERINEMTAILLTIKKERGISIEELAESLGLGYSRIADMTGQLEADGIITVDLLQRCYINFFNIT